MAGSGPPIVELDAYEESINMLVYGDSGVGKTVFAGTAERALFLSTETGTISAKRQGSKAKLWACPTWEDILEAYDWLKHNPDEFDWVLLDSLTEMQQHLRDYVLRQVVKENPSRDPDILAIQDYQKWYLVYEKFIRAFNGLPQNVLYTALARRNEDEEAEPLILPMIEGQGYGKAVFTCAAMHVVGYYGVRQKDGKETRRMLFQNSPPYFAKDRYAALGRFIDDPTIPQIAARINDIDTPAKAPAKATKAPAKAAKATPAA